MQSAEAKPPSIEDVNNEYLLRDTGVSNASSWHDKPRHRWYAFKEGFSPDIVERAISDSGIRPRSKVVDPFCGSGTVALTASRRGIDVTAYEVNPFISFLAKAKIVKCAPSAFLSDRNIALDALKEELDSPLESFSSFGQSGGRDKWLFNADILRSFESAWVSTGSIVCPNSKMLVQLCLLGAVMSVCNAYRDGKCLRYRSDWATRKLRRDDLIAKFQERADLVYSDLLQEGVLKGRGGLGRATIIEGDCRTLMGSYEKDEKFHLCVTSPPYLNSFDYSDIYRPELFLGKFIKTNQDLYRLRLKTIRSHVQAAWATPSNDTQSTLLSDVLEKLEGRALWSNRLPDMVRAYFDDMKLVMDLLSRNARDGAQLWMVVSTSAYGGVVIPVDLILADLANSVGWNLREVGVLRNLRASGQHWSRRDESEGTSINLLRESVVILQKPQKRRR
jgi:hypothetical protein